MDSLGGIASGWNIDTPAVREALHKVYGEGNADGTACPELTYNVFDMFRYLIPSKVRVVIIGQDPYPRKADACGRAFWALNNTPRSARSIFKNLKSYGHITDEDVPPRATFNGWVTQGVIMVNTTPTVHEGTPDSHYKIWENITAGILSALPHSSVALHLGTRAASVPVPCAYSVRHTHPVLPSEEEFQTDDCFGKVNDCLVRLGLGRIYWNRFI